MNTRDKILANGGAEAPRKLKLAPRQVLVIGTFDPLLAAHSERLTELKNKAGATLFVAVADLPYALLDRRARMELVAALRVVDFVMPYEKGLESASCWTSVHDDTPLHARWSADFKEHVRHRSQSA